jgi:hypothetical protein
MPLDTSTRDDVTERSRGWIARDIPFSVACREDTLTLKEAKALVKGKLGEIGKMNKKDRLKGRSSAN